MATRIPFIGETSTSRSSFVDYQKTVNLYPEQSPSGRNSLVLYPTPGYTPFSIMGLSPTRGGVVFGTHLYSITGNQLYRVTTTGGTTLVGTLGTEEGQVRAAHNGTEIIFVDGLKGYIYNDTYSTFTEIKQFATGTTDGTTANRLVDSTATFITDGVVAGSIVYNDTDNTSSYVSSVISETELGLLADIFVSGENYTVGDADFPNGATHVEFFDGYFVANDPSASGRFRISTSYSGVEWPPLSFATAERSPDVLQAIVVNGRELWLLGSETAEPWYNSGAPIVPFEPIQSGFSEWGCVAPYSVATNNGAVFWLTGNRQGQGKVVMAEGMQPKIISSDAISDEISTFATIDDAFGWTYDYQRHSFYVLTFPTENRTFVYDVATNMWHEWSSGGIDKRHISNFHVFFDGKHIVGSYKVGQLLTLDWDTYSENGDKIHRLRRSPYIYNGNDDHLVHYKVKVEFETGVGDNDIPEPQAMLRWTNDGRNFSNELWRTIGSRGEYYTTVEWRKLGRSKYRAYEVVITDPVKVVISNAYVDVSERSGGD